MNINKLASSIHRGKFLMEPNFAKGERLRARKFLSKDFSTEDTETEDKELEKCFVIVGSTYSKIVIDDWSGEIVGLAQTGNVCVIPICGTIMKYDFCGTPGTDTLGSWLKAAIASPQIDAIVLLINSGGGSVEGTGEFADIVKSSDKTILTFCDGMLASAAYWIGSAAKEVWVSHKTAEIGSIGVAACFFDDSKALEEAGYQDIYINADTSPDKNMDYFDAIKGDYSSMKANSLNPLDQIFMGTIKDNREGKLKLTDVIINDEVYQEPLTGKVYLAETAIKNGLIDGICTIEQCVDKALNFKSNDKKTNNMATVDKEKAAKKSETFLEKVKALLFASESDSTIESDASKKGDDEENETAKKSDDEEMKGAKKADDDNDNPDDKNDDDDSDEDDVEVNGKVYSMKDPAQAKAAIAAAVDFANKEIADRDTLLEEANTIISENVEELKKSDKEVRETIKSKFTIKGSQRTNKIGVNDNEGDGQAFKPAEGSYADQILKRALAKSAAAAKSVK
ncbi:MAG: S49 family peptidase [Candidatus Babeliales bacterium]|nr:S49 family peptidase [Candidatus Babeliales bacterium]